MQYNFAAGFLLSGLGLLALTFNRSGSGVACGAVIAAIGFVTLLEYAIGIDVVSVRDSGEGIAPENLERVIEPFFTTKGMAKHSGLGLSMVHGFSQQSGGHFEIESEEGSLPGGSETILLVEDDQNVRRSLAAMLERKGYGVVAREDGPEGLRYVEAHKVDLLISDVVMPGGLSGPELAIEARNLQPLLKVLLISGYAEVSGVADGDAILGKPVSGDKLVRTVREILDLA